jgi:thiamine transport system ATP-binding protein
MLRAHELSVTFGDLTAVHRVSIEAADGETVALVGRSGSGKTTLLRAIAGLVPTDAGRVEVNGIDVSSTPAHLRGIGLVFQDFALFPHLDVGANVGYGIGSGNDRTNRIAEALQLVGLEGMESRPTYQLSGGQAQRVALARTLASRPGVLLLDEPMGSLDRAYRRQVAEELGSLLSSTGIPTILVTHDVEEAFALGDRIVVLEDGAVVAAGPSASVWAQPGTADAARILGHTAIVAAEITNGVAHVDATPIQIAADSPNGPATVLIRNARLMDVGGIPLPVAYSRFSGPLWTTGLRIGDGVLEVMTAHWFEVGDIIHVAIDAADVTVL